MFDQLGIGSEQAAGMSTSIVELAADFASFANADISEVLNAQSAAFRGEYDSLQRFLPLINATTVDQKALALTGKSVAKELTAQQKALAVNTLMMEGAGDAVGDFERTSGSLANQIRILNAEWENTKTELGTQLLPIFIKFTGFLEASVIPAIRDLFTTGGDAESWGSKIQDVFADVTGFFLGTIQTVLRGIATAIEALPFNFGSGIVDNARDAADALDDIRGELHATKAELQRAADTTSVFTDAQALLANVLEDTVSIVDLHTEATRESDKAVRDAAKAQRTLAGAQRDLNELLEEGAVSEEKIADARQNLADATRAAAHADRELTEAQERYDAALANANDLHGWDTAQDELADATLNLADAQANATESHEDAAEAEKELRLAQAGDPDYQDKLADARDRVADATDAIAAADDKAVTATDKLTAATDKLNTSTDTLKTNLADVATNMDLIWAGRLNELAMGGNVNLEPPSAESYYDPLAVAAEEFLTAPPPQTPKAAPGDELLALLAMGGASTTQKNVTINVTQTDPDPVDLAHKMIWALE